MGKLGTQPTRPEPIAFKRTVAEDDGRNGTVGVAQIVHKCMAIVTPLRASRLVEANQQSLRRGYEFEFYVNPAFEPQASDTIVYRDEELTNQGFQYKDMSRRKYLLTAVEQVNGQNWNIGQES